MHRVVEDLTDLAEFDDASQVHDGHPVGDVPHHRQVVRHEQVGKPHLLAKLLQQVEHPGTNRDVQGRHRLVEHEELGLQGQCPGDAHALLLASGEVTRVPVGMGRFQTDQAHEFTHPIGDVVLGATVVLQRLGQDVVNRHARVERGHRVLEDNLQVLAHRLAVGTVKSPGVLAQHDNPSILGGGKFEDRHDRRRLAATGLTDQAERLALLDTKRNAVDGVDGAHPALEHRPLHERIGLDEPIELEDIGEGLTLGKLQRPLGPCPGTLWTRIHLVVVDVDEVGGTDAGREVIVQVRVHQVWLTLTARIDGHRASRSERAARRQVEQ